MSSLLPVGNSVPESNLYRFKMFLAGDKKVGKTSFANAFKNAFIIQFEPGNDAHIACRSVSIRDTITLQQVIDQLRRKPEYCNTLVVDGVQMLYELIWTEACEAKSVASPDEANHGIVWGIIGQKWRHFINELNDLGKFTIYTAHAEWKYDKQGTPTEYDAVLMSQVRKSMKNLTHMWFYMVHGKDSARQLIIEGTQQYKAGHAFGKKFGGKNVIDLGKTPEEAVSNFIAAWEKSKAPKFTM